MVGDPDDFSFDQSVIPVVLVQWDEAHEAEYSCNENCFLTQFNYAGTLSGYLPVTFFFVTAWLSRHTAPLVQHEWVLDCIGKYAVTSFSTMLLCDVSEDYLASMRIPSYLFEFTEESDQ